MSTFSNHCFENFSQRLLAWFDQHGRKNLPWKAAGSAYPVWISEIMLQQTQVQTVIPYFLRFLNRFPDNSSLSQAELDEVLAQWSGLGYYSRARNLHKTSKIIFHDYQNIFPESIEIIRKLPGIGPSTAAAIASQAFNQPEAILDGNVKRVLCRHFLVDGIPDKSAVKAQLIALAENCMSKTRPADYTQAIMDFGATYCTRSKPNCLRCPFSTSCLAYNNAVVADYPAKKAKKLLPLKQEQFILFFDKNNHVYLERREEKGIWGGLWSLPAVDSNLAIKAFIAGTFHCDTDVIVPFMQFKHSFTHFHLQIEVFTIATENLSFFPNPVTGQWFDSRELSKVGLPGPVSQILNHFYEVEALKQEKNCV